MNKTETQIELMPENHEHYAKVVCKHTGKFLQWISERDIPKDAEVIVPPKFRKLF
jgi:hypothetical protein